MVKFDSNHPFKILVANRGEIAIRVLRAASELKSEFDSQGKSLRTVAIYTYEDRYSQHRYKADEAYQIGEKDDPLKPYLNIEAIIRTALKNGVNAIHPGYGFLSENVNFARRCREAGIIFIGPEPEVMERLGDKVKAKEMARSVQVPVIEDSLVKLEDMEVLKIEAQGIGYPVILKAASGGGGRGMRVVRNEIDLVREFLEAKSEAKTAFGDDTVFLEKFIENPKHIEVQLIGDNYGNLRHLYERDCSVQRRFQKVVEVAPSVGLAFETRRALYDYALKIGRAVQYNNAGTVEFLVDQNEQIYFIEVNPRVQVEHTITEEVTKIDIVRSQILIALGYKLSDPLINIPPQELIRPHGFAVQCRVTTEDPSNGFKPDYGKLIAYRSASGMGIRLDAGNAYPGAIISPYFDSLLVKVTASGRSLKDASRRLERALREFRIRGVKTNISFLLELLRDETFTRGAARVNFIKDHPELLVNPGWRDRATKMIRFLAETIVNGNPDVKTSKENVPVFIPAKIPDFKAKYHPDPNECTRKIFENQGRAAVIEYLKNQKAIQYTDTTFRDAHQSLLATRMRTRDLLAVIQQFDQRHGADIFSMEVWGGATYDVALRFLKEDPWERLRLLRTHSENILFQMLLRGSNAVGYAAYPDNLIEKFIEKASEEGIHIFRIFDSLNWVEAMKVSIKTVLRTSSIAEACICYTGDFTSANERKYTLQYYLDLARRLEDEGAHILAIKDMAGLLKPYAAQELIGRLKESVNLPIHLHTHDTSSIQSATYLKAVEADVDVIDVAISSLSGLTAQPSFNSVVAMMQGHDREKSIDLNSLNEFSNYWEAVRRYYYTFESELRSGTAEVYAHEIPGGQYSNLRPQARGLGLEDQFDTIKKNYKAANDLFGNLIKVTPSSKVVGDMAMFMTANQLTKEEVLQKGKSIDFPDSVKALMRGDLGQMEGGFPTEVQAMVLKGEPAYQERPNAHLEPLDFEAEELAFKAKFDWGKREGWDIMHHLLSYKLYPKVYENYYHHYQTYGPVWKLPSPAFFFGLQPNEEIVVTLSSGKDLFIKYLNQTEADEHGMRVVFFQLNGMVRSISIKDNSLKVDNVAHRKAERENEIGSPLQGNLAKVLVKEGQQISLNDPLFVIEAMKMESTVTASVTGTVKKIHISERTLVEQGDLVVELV